MATLQSTGAGTAPTRPTVPGWAPLVVVLTGTFVTYLDFFIVNVALPSIHSELHAGPAALQSVVAGFALTFAAGLISGGRLGDMYGRRRIFGVGMALFTVTSAACGLAPNAEVLVVSRLLQGLSAALMTPQVLAILGTVYEGARRAKAFAKYGLTMGAAAVLGQVIGGSLIALDLAGSGWRSIFLINVPVGIAALAALRRTVPESHGERTSLDLVGTVLVTGAIAAVVLPLVEGREAGWPAWTWACFAAAPVLFASFVVHQWRRDGRGRAPLVRPAMFRGRRFTVGTLTGIAFGGVPASLFFVLALYLQEGRRLSALESGLVFTAIGAGYFAAMLTAERMATRLGRQLLAIGAVMVGAGSLLLATVASAPIPALLPGLAVVGFGIGMVLVPLTATALADVAHTEAGAASGVLATSLQLGGALSVAAVGAVYYAALGHGVAGAYAESLVVLAVVTALTAGLVQLLPRR